MEVSDTQNPTPRREHLSAPVFRKKRSQTIKKRKLYFQKPVVFKKKSKQVRKVSSGKNLQKSESIKRKRAKAREIYDDPETRFNILKKAERLYKSLAIETPYFFKPMLPSNVTYSFWMIMPKSFCNSYLPSQDATIFLVDEWGKEHRTTYLMDRHGLSAGWRGFAMSHVLLKGDVLIFNLIEPCRFKVYIVRLHAPDVVNAALCLMSMAYDLAKQDNKKHKRVNRYDTIVLDAPREQVKVEEKWNVALASQSETCSDSFSSEVVQGAEINDNLISSGHHFLETAFVFEPPREFVSCM